MTDKNKSENWKFIHSQADKANWKPGLREIFDYRDLGFILADGSLFKKHSGLSICFVTVAEYSILNSLCSHAV